jgi:hypothetical protein
MAKLRRVLVAVVVAVTALSMLGAGMPHVDCVCPDRGHKTFCTGVGRNSESCCCKGGCCGSSGGGCCSRGKTEAKPKQQHACCAGRAEKAKKAVQQSGRQVSSSGCKRTWVAGKPSGFVPVHGRPGLAKTTDGLVSFLPRCSVARGLDSTRSIEVWQRHAIPPPDDLIVTLQHFNI